MIITRTQLTRWIVAGATIVGSALLTTAAAEAWGLPGRVVTLEANDKSNHELLMEMRSDLKEVLRKVDRLPE